jgi:hypothetical protein
MRAFSFVAGIIACFSLYIFQGCSSPRKAVEAKGPVVKAIPFCKDQLISRTPPLEWYKENKDNLRGLRDQQLPQVYEVYSITDNNLKRFFGGAEETRVTNIPLPDPIGCQVYELSNSGAMSAALQKKFPGIVSFKGQSISNKASEVRMDYGNGKMNAAVVWGNSSFIVKPVEASGRVYYIVYDMKYSVDKRQPFEQNAPQENIKRYDR